METKEYQFAFSVQEIARRHVWDVFKDAGKVAFDKVETGFVVQVIPGRNSAADIAREVRHTLSNASVEEGQRLKNALLGDFEKLLILTAADDPILDDLGFKDGMLRYFLYTGAQERISFEQTLIAGQEFYDRIPVSIGDEDSPVVVIRALMDFQNRLRERVNNFGQPQTTRL